MSNTAEERTRSESADACERRVHAALAGPPYQAYAYSYPHKLAYRPLAPPRPLDALWAREDRAGLFLYAHVPFCEQRCGFCNLFTFARPREATVDAYLDAFERQAGVVRSALGDASFARAAVGGGTPTYLGPSGLERLLAILERTFDVDLGALPCSIEVSPETATEEALAPIARRRLDRVSMGVQSFVEGESLAVQRRQSSADVDRAIEAIRRAGARVLNLDLMYGLPGQTEASFEASLDAALAHRPEELYLYPLYVRPLTSLSRRGAPDDSRVALYRFGRARLLDAGYAQVSMRMFRKADLPALPGPAYRCQSDGMVGLGCGARSYTETVHYSSAYATGTTGVRDILERWIGSSDDAFGRADWGFVLDDEDRRRRFVILSLLSDEGLSLREYARRFGSEALADVPELPVLIAWREVDGAQLVVGSGERLSLTERGVERSDVIGPLLASQAVRALSGGAERR